VETALRGWKHTNYNMRPKPNKHGVYCEYTKTITIGKDNYHEPHCHIRIVMLSETEWVGATDFETNKMKWSCQGMSSPVTSEPLFASEELLVKYYSKELLDRYLRICGRGDTSVDKIIDQLEELADAKPVKQLKLF